MIWINFGCCCCCFYVVDWVLIFFNLIQIEMLILSSFTDKFCNLFGGCEFFFFFVKKNDKKINKLVKLQQFSAYFFCE